MHDIFFEVRDLFDRVGTAQIERPVDYSAAERLLSAVREAAGAYFCPDMAQMAERWMLINGRMECLGMDLSRYYEGENPSREIYDLALDIWRASEIAGIAEGF